MKINVKLKGLDNIIKRLNRLIINVDTMAKEIMDTLSYNGYVNATLGFQEAQYDGDNDVVVSLKWEGNKVELIASGTSVLFIEFGSGIHYDSGNPLRKTTTPNVGAIGSYGRGQGATGKHWIYYSNDYPLNPTPSFIGSGDTYTTSGYKSAYTSVETRSWQTKSGMKSKQYVVYHKARQGKPKTRTMKDGWNATKGNPPARVMYDASETMHKQIGSVIMEVVKKYVRH